MVSKRLPKICELCGHKFGLLIFCNKVQCPYRVEIDSRLDKIIIYRCNLCDMEFESLFKHLQIEHNCKPEGALLLQFAEINNIRLYGHGFISTRLREEQRNDS